jgi:hypothetical protein
MSSNSEPEGANEKGSISIAVLSSVGRSQPDAGWLSSIGGRI